MATKLQCEICGGKLVGKPGGVFECESCGTEYSTEWAKAKIQEITGTVKVEGTVEIQGKVQVEGTANAQSLVKRGYFALNDEEWEDAKKFFNEALNADPENAEAYLGLVIEDMRLHDKDEFATQFVDDYSIICSYREFERAVQFSTSELKTWFSELDQKRKAEVERQNSESKAASKRIEPIRENISAYQCLVSAGLNHSLVALEDGTAFAIGQEFNDECNVQNWNGVVAVSAGENHSVALKADGTVVAVGYNDDGECNTNNWTNIVAVAAGGYHTVGLKSDGTVVATEFIGDYYRQQCAVTDWTDIVAVASGSWHTVGLKTDGTVVAVGSNRDDQCDVTYWKGIVAVSAAESHTVGLKSDGTVVATGNYEYGRCNVSDWTDIVAISAGFYHTVGIKADGTVVAVGKNDNGQCDVEDWTDVVAISAGGYHTVGLKKDGTVVACGKNNDGQCNVLFQKLFRTVEEKQADYAKACALQESGEEKDLAEAASIFSGLKDYRDCSARAVECDRAYKELKTEREKREKAEREAREARERAERAAAEEKARQERIATLNTEKANLQTELANLKGLFSGRRRKEIEARLAQIENELEKL